MVKIDDNTNVDLDQLAIVEYNELILPINQDGRYHASQSLIGRIERQKELDRLIPDPIRLIFWDYFLNNNYANLRRVIVSRPDELQIIVDEVNLQFGAVFLSLSHSYSNAQLTDFGQIVKNVFNYENYRNSERPAIYFNSYNINYCTYCNKDEIQNIEEINNATGNLLRTRLYQLDHFYPRSRYPYLSLSFFNLIPGCANCNATLKGERDFNVTTHFNPFHKSFNDHFNFKVSTILPKKLSEISIDFENPYNHPDITLEDFKILHRYNQGIAPELIFEMINLFKHRTRKVQSSILSQLRGLSGSVEHSNNDLLRSQGVPIAPNHINKKQYGKLKRDVCRQMKIL